MEKKKKDNEKERGASFQPQGHVADVVVENGGDITINGEDAKEHGLDIPVGIVEPEKPKPISKVQLSKGARHYEGPTTKLMNTLYDNMMAERVSPMTGQVLFVVTDLEGWSRTSIHMAKACERLEKAGWRKR